MTTTQQRQLADAITDAQAHGETFQRSFMAQRAEADTERREVSGLGVPYGEVIEHYFGRETFDPGSIEGIEQARLLWQHRDPIGLVTGHEDSEAGMSITARVSQTSLGSDALTLARDGVVTGLSIGFEPLEWRVEAAEDGTETIHWTRVIAREFSLVTFAAYSTAEVATVRNAHRTTNPDRSTPMDTDTITPEAVATQLRAATEPLDQAITDLERRVALIVPGQGQARTESQWGSMGEFVRALATGDESAAEFYTRAFAGGTTDDIVVDDGTGFLGNFIRFIQERRRIISLFSTGALPAKGMSVTYGRLEDDTLVVGKQANQGDPLPGPGKLLFGDDSAPVETYGGWSELSRQAIERAELPYLDNLWTALGLRYVRETEAAVRSVFQAEVASHVTAGGDEVIELPATADAYDWIDALVDAGEVYEDRGFNMQGLLASPDKFKAWARMEGNDGRPLMNVFGQGVNTVGQLNIPAGDGELARIPVRILRKTTGLVAGYDPLAIKTLEAPGAPFRLQDDNIINLTRAFSLYGYMATIVPFPGAIVPFVNATA